MKLELFTSKTVKQCVHDLNARFEEKETKARPAIGGYAEKNGEFMLTTSSRILILNRTTRLKGTFEKDKDMTFIKGYVSDGVPTEKVGIIMLALGVVALTMLLKGQAIFAILVVMVSVGAYISLIGDYTNSTYLLKELKRMTGAKDKPSAVTASVSKSPVKAQSARPAVKSASVKKPATSTKRATASPTAKKPAPKTTTKTSATTSRPSTAKKTATSSQKVGVR